MEVSDGWRRALNSRAQHASKLQHFRLCEPRRGGRFHLTLLREAKGTRGACRNCTVSRAPVTSAAQQREARGGSACQSRARLRTVNNRSCCSPHAPHGRFRTCQSTVGSELGPAQRPRPPPCALWRSTSSSRLNGNKYRCCAPLGTCAPHLSVTAGLGAASAPFRNRAADANRQARPRMAAGMRRTGARGLGGKAAKQRCATFGPYARGRHCSS